MKRVSERAEEARAKEIVERVLGVEVVRLDDGGASVADYQLMTADGERVALEVTTSAVRSDLRTASAREKRGWTTDGLANDWFLSFTRGLKVRELYEQRRELLLQLEAVGIERLDARDDEHHADLRRRLTEVGIRRATAVAAAGPSGANIYFGSVTVGTSAPSDVSAAVEVEAWKPDNRTKLGSAGHLFVWIDATASDANAAMSFGALPEGLNAPPELAAAWAAPGPYRDVDYLANPVWLWTNDLGVWRDLGKL